MSSVVLRNVVHFLATHGFRSRLRQRGLSSSGWVLKVMLGVEGDVGRAVLREHDRAEVERQVGEGARLDAAAARAGGELDRAGRGGELHDQAGMRDGLAVTAERRVGAVKDGRVAGRLNIEAPLPVGNVAIVAALLQLLLENVDEVAMPREEVSLS